MKHVLLTTSVVLPKQFQLVVLRIIDIFYYSQYL